MNELLRILHFCFLFRFCAAFTGELFPFQRHNDCKIQEYYSVNTLTCKICQKDKFLVPTDDKLSCTCNNRTRIIRWEGEFPLCSLCKENEIPTSDQEECISCLNDEYRKSKCTKTNCEQNEIYVERDLRGNLLPAMSCTSCANGTMPNSQKNVCIPCLIPNCTCPTITHELLDVDICAPKNDLATLPDEQNIYMVDFDHVHQVFRSHYLKTYLRSSLYKCTKLKRSKHCQAVANMCVMLLYKDEQNGGPCRLFREYRYIPTSTSNNNHLPWLYYGEGDASILLNRKKIETHYSLYPDHKDSMLHFFAAHYALDGTFLGLIPVSGSDIQICPGISKYMDLAFRFGSRYKHSCVLTAKELLQKTKHNEFFDLYLQHYDKSQSLLYAVPLVIKNVSVNAEFSNKDVDVSQWLLTRRFFFLDNVSGVAYSSEKFRVVSDVSPSVIRYLKSAKLWIKTRREKEDEGKIYPPFLILEYGELTNEDVQTNALVQFSFSVDYYMDNDIPHIIDVTIGILSAAVVVWSGIQTWSYCRRSGQVTIDMSTLLELGLTCCGYFSNMLFIVAAAVALHTLLFYKAQSVAYIMLPSESLENTINKYIVVAFLLKIVEVVRLIYVQMKIDIFLIDWERPRATGGANSTELPQPVSIWRTYFVANEWNEIQTKRKTSLLLQMLLTLMILKVYGVENWTQADPDVHIEHIPYRPESLLLRFGVTLVVYLFVYLSQWLLVVGVYERYIKNGIQEFVDVCSMANVSVFILLQENYGYYIHGRSAHGFADTDMQTILTQLRREEDDLVGHRGLLPGTEQQTFQIIIPTALRTYYNKVMSPLNIMNNKQSGSTFRMRAVNNDDAGRIVDAYNNMNKFLAAFLDHALKDLDYEVREKLFVEQLLDIEFWDSLDRGVFYIDNGHSFDGVLFYGNEGTLFSFDLMMFLCIDVFCHDILYAAILTLIISQIIAWLRNRGGRRNLAKKTLVDDRFLI